MNIYNFHKGELKLQFKQVQREQFIHLQETLKNGENMEQFLQGGFTFQNGGIEAQHSAILITEKGLDGESILGRHFSKSTEYIDMWSGRAGELCRLNGWRPD